MYCVLREVQKSFVHNGGLLPVIETLSLEIQSGQFVALVGPSGCGKTTLLRMIAGLEQTSAGDILINGQPVRGPRADTGMVTQSYSLFPWLTVRQNISFGLKLHSGVWTKAIDHSPQVDEMLGAIGLHDFGEAYPATLSGGMKQRVALARSMVLRPGLLLLDEPLAALDSPTRITLQEMINRLTAEFKTTVCLVTHDAEEALYLAHTIYLLSRRPARIREIISNDASVVRDFAFRATLEFQTRKQRLLSLILEETSLADIPPQM